eukprot:Amastigsp_a342455_5.p2 type:complete len:233 gc:universal Amastigsp_a342455_5:723-25(-)
MRLEPREAHVARETARVHKAASTAWRRRARIEGPHGALADGARARSALNKGCKHVVGTRRMLAPAEHTSGLGIDGSRGPSLAVEGFRTEPAAETAAAAMKDAAKELDTLLRRSERFKASGTAVEALEPIRGHDLDLLRHVLALELCEHPRAVLEAKHRRRFVALEANLFLVAEHVEHIRAQRRLAKSCRYRRHLVAERNMRFEVQSADLFVRRDSARDGLVDKREVDSWHEK